MRVGQHVEPRGSRQWPPPHLHKFKRHHPGNPSDRVTPCPHCVTDTGAVSRPAPAPLVLAALSQTNYPGSGLRIPPTASRHHRHRGRSAQRSKQKQCLNVTKKFCGLKPKQSNEPRWGPGHNPPHQQATITVLVL